MELIEREEIKEIKEYKDNCVIFLVGIILIMCAWVFVYRIWEATGRKIPHRILTKIIELIALASGIWYVRKQRLKPEEMGLGKNNLGKILIMNTIFSVSAIVIMVIAKVIIINSNFNFFEESKPIWDWNTMTIFSWIYPLTALMEEFIINGIMQESLDRIFEGKHKVIFAIGVSAIYFGAVHVHKGLVHMTISSIMAIFLCIAYRRQRNIWGISLSHYLLGMAATFLGYI